MLRAVGEARCNAVLSKLFVESVCTRDRERSALLWLCPGWCGLCGNLQLTPSSLQMCRGLA